MQTKYSNKIKKLLFTTLLLSPLLACQVYACSMLEIPDKEKFERAKSIFMGKAVATKLSTLNPAQTQQIEQDFFYDKEKWIALEVTFEVLETLKGQPPASHTLLTIYSGPEHCPILNPVISGGEYMFVLSNDDDIWSAKGYRILMEVVPYIDKQITNYRNYAKDALKNAAH